MSEAGTIVDPEKLDPVALWSAEVDAAEKELEKFHNRGRGASRKFVDERDAINTGSKWFNIYYANTNILESALYAQLPKPAVSRKFTDYNDDVGRVAALIIERSITQDLDDPDDTFDSTMRHCVQDRLVPGLAQAWLRLETDTEDISVPPTPGNDAGEEEAPKRITDQRICVDYIFWEDFLWSPCRIWEERRWVGRKAYMTREELIERFGEEKGKACPLDFNSRSQKGKSIQSMTPKEDVLKKAVVYEIWDRTTRKVIWYAKGMLELLDEKDDPLGLKGFEPCPTPMLANTSTSNTVPRPDYYMLQDQYNELDDINARISLLIKACKVVGVYDKNGGAGVARMLKEGFDNDLIPVDNWAMFAEKGGLKGTIDWLPLEQVVLALRELNAAREVIKGQIYELTGIADIVRGASKASETLGAQQIKAQFASVRIKKLQDEAARFASDIMRIKAEIMIKHFDPQLIIAKSGILATGNDEFIAPAMKLLQDEGGFEWRIQVNADTMSQADYAMEKQDRIEFLSSVSQFMGEFAPMMESDTAFKPILVGLLKWSVAGFRGARDIEGMLDKQLDMLSKPKPAEPPKPDPEMLKVQAQQAKDQADVQVKQSELQIKQGELQLKQGEVQTKQQFEQQKLAFEAQEAKAKLESDERIAREKLAADTQIELLKLELEKAKLALEKAKIESDERIAREKCNTDAQVALTTAREKQASDEKLAQDKLATDTQVAREKQASDEKLSREKHASDAAISKQKSASESSSKPKESSNDVILEKITKLIAEATKKPKRITKGKDGSYTPEY